MKHKKIVAIIALSFISVCGVALLLVGARADRERGLAQLPLPRLSACNSSSHPRLPKRFRAVYLMAPFTTGQLVISEIVHDGPLGATRITLYGVERGVADFLILGDETYSLPTAETNGNKCTALGDTGWRPLPADWLTATSRCAGSLPVLKTPVSWWKTPIKPSPGSYWIWFKHSDETPFRLVFEYPTNTLAAFSQFAMSNQIAFLPLDNTDLADVALSCKNARAKSVTGAPALVQALDAMSHATAREDKAIARLVPALTHNCAAPTKPLWPERLAITGMLTPFDSNEDPAPMEVLYDWSVPGQRSRMFPPRSDVVARDALLLQAGGYNVAYRYDGAAMCGPGLPGTVRPDWSQRAPCECSAQIDVGTQLTPDEPLQILSCPLNLPRIAWAWYALSGTPKMFMVTSKVGDEGTGSFAVLDYHQWIPHLPVDRSAFAKPAECPDSPVSPPGMPTAAVTNCTTCHSSGNNR